MGNPGANITLGEILDPNDISGCESLLEAYFLQARFLCWPSAFVIHLLKQTLGISLQCEDWPHAQCGAIDSLLMSWDSGGRCELGSLNVLHVLLMKKGYAESIAILPSRSIEQSMQVEHKARLEPYKMYNRVYVCLMLACIPDCRLTTWCPGYRH